jgi:hypothetical protein
MARALLRLGALCIRQSSALLHLLLPSSHQVCANISSFQKMHQEHPMQGDSSSTPKVSRTSECLLALRPARSSSKIKYKCAMLRSRGVENVSSMLRWLGISCLPSRYPKDNLLDPWSVFDQTSKLKNTCASGSRAIMLSKSQSAVANKDSRHGIRCL